MALSTPPSYATLHHIPFTAMPLLAEILHTKERQAHRPRYPEVRRLDVHDVTVTLEDGDLADISAGGIGLLAFLDWLGMTLEQEQKLQRHILHA